MTGSSPAPRSQMRSRQAQATSAGASRLPVWPRLGIAPRHRTFESCTARILRIVCSGRVCSHRFAVGHDRQLASTPSSDAIAAGTGLRRWGQPALGAASEGDIPSVANRWKLAQPGFYISFRVSHACSHRFAAGHDRQLAITSISDVIAASTGHRRWGKLAPGTASRGFPPSIETMGACTACFLRIIIEAAVGALILRPWALSFACDSRHHSSGASSLSGLHISTLLSVVIGVSAVHRHKCYTTHGTALRNTFGFVPRGLAQP